MLTVPLLFPHPRLTIGPPPCPVIIVPPHPPYRGAVQMVSEIKEEVIDLDDNLEDDFKAEKISAETVVLNEDGKKMPLPAKKH